MLDARVETVAESQVTKAEGATDESLALSTRHVMSITLRAALSVALRNWISPEAFATLAAPVGSAGGTILTLAQAAPEDRGRLPSYHHKLIFAPAAHPQ